MKQIDWEDAAECMKMLSHPHRLEIISILLERECSVGEIAEACGLLHNVASEHLSLMKNKQLIKARKEGRQVFYSVHEPALSSIIGCIKKRFSHD